MQRRDYSGRHNEHVKTDCFAYSPCFKYGKADCAALKTLYCAAGGACSFYATKSEAAEARRRVDDRLRGMCNYDKLREIYGGWKDG